MGRNLLNLVVFLVGLLAVGWIGVGYIGSNPLGAAVAALVGIGYVAGAWELYRYRQATAALDGAVAALSSPPAVLGDWLDRLPSSLRHPVRLRVEGERVALPAPALTPYLVGLLVLLGMLGTLLGMMATLRGTGMALESATDLQSIRGSLAAPVKGLGFAFGTSIAGVASSAMLGLLSALCRRERMLVVQRLDAAMATTLRVHSQAHQRDVSFRLMQEQAGVLPALADRLQTMMEAIEQHSLAAHERQVASQQSFQSTAEAVYARLASSVERSLKDGAVESARIAGAALQPVVESTMATLSRETAALHESVTQAVQSQLGALRPAVESTVAALSRETAVLHESITQATQRQLDALQPAVESTLNTLSNGTTTLHDTLTEAMKQQLDTVRSAVESTMTALSQETTALRESVTQAVQRQLDGLQPAMASTMSTLAREAASLHEAVSEAATRQLDAVQPAVEATLAALSRETASLHDTLTQAVQRQIDGHASAWEKTTASVGSLWTDALAEQRRSNSALTDDLRQTLDRVGEGFERRSGDLVDRLSSQAEAASLRTIDAWNASLSLQKASNDELAQRNQQAWVEATTAFEATASSFVDILHASQVELQKALASRDDERLTAWTDSLASLADTLSAQWAKAGDDATHRQQAMCDTLEQTAGAITAQAEAHAGATIAEISRLVEAAAEAPRAAADVVAQLRQSLSESMVRDTAMLEERTRLLATLETLLDAVNHASTEQRAAVDALVGTSADLLERVGTRFVEQVEAETGKLGSVAAQITGGAVEVASLGEAFGAAVQSFGQSNDALMERLQEIAAALDRSMVRSDEQLAYYVAQAREVVDLSVLSQKQIIEDMQHLAAQRGGTAAA